MLASDRIFACLPTMIQTNQTISHQYTIKVHLIQTANNLLAFALFLASYYGPPDPPKTIMYCSAAERRQLRQLLLYLRLRLQQSAWSLELWLGLSSGLLKLSLPITG